MNIRFREFKKYGYQNYNFAILQIVRKSTTNPSEKISRTALPKLFFPRGIGKKPSSLGLGKHVGIVAGALSSHVLKIVTYLEAKSNF